MPGPIARLPGYSGAFAGFGDSPADGSAPDVPVSDPGSMPDASPTSNGVAPLQPGDPGYAPTSTPPALPQQIVPAPASPAATSLTSNARTRAGAAIVLAGAGLGAGAYFGGSWGAGSGLLAAGALCNAYRASSLWKSPSPSDHSEVIKSTIMTVIGLGAAGYLGYKAYEKKKV